MLLAGFAFQITKSIAGVSGYIYIYIMLLATVI
jgi:hypothetical protein